MRRRDEHSGRGSERSTWANPVLLVAELAGADLLSCGREEAPVHLGKIVAGERLGAASTDRGGVGGETRRGEGLAVAFDAFGVAGRSQRFQQTEGSHGRDDALHMAAAVTT